MIYNYNPFFYNVKVHNKDICFKAIPHNLGVALTFL